MLQLLPRQAPPVFGLSKQLPLCPSVAAGVDDTGAHSSVLASRRLRVHFCVLSHLSHLLCVILAQKVDDLCRAGQAASHHVVGMGCPSFCQVQPLDLSLCACIHHRSSLISKQRRLEFALM
jgi:hypothetical protein